MNISVLSKSMSMSNLCLYAIYWISYWLRNKYPKRWYWDLDLSKKARGLMYKSCVCTKTFRCIKLEMSVEKSENNHNQCGGHQRHTFENICACYHMGGYKTVLWKCPVPVVMEKLFNCEFCGDERVFTEWEFHRQGLYQARTRPKPD